MISKLIVLIFMLTTFGYSTYIPEFIATVTSEFVNKQIQVNVGPMISQFINKNLTIKNITNHQEVVGGVHIKLNLTNIKQSTQIRWNTSLLNVVDQHSFDISSKNINVTLKGNLEFKIGYLPIQKGQLIIQITQLQTHSSYSLYRPNCTSKNIGFSVSVKDISINSQSLNIEIKGKNLDNRIINIVKKLVINRIPNYINSTLKPTINQQLYKYSCIGPIQQTIFVGTQTYLIALNTTDVPYFANKKVLTIPLDVTLFNELTNQTNTQTDNETIFDQHIYQNSANLTLTMSSNAIDTGLWLLDDSNLLTGVITKDQLPPTVPITLDTEGLAILLPGLRKWPKKGTCNINLDVILRTDLSSKNSKAFMRSGRLMAAISVEADFIINMTGKPQNLNDCLKKGDCIIAASLNITLGASVSLRTEKLNTWAGLLQSVYIHEIQIINSQIDIKLENLKSIFNTLISSARPQINQILQEGTVLNPSSIDQLKQLNVTGLMGNMFYDYASVGVLFDL